MVHYLPLLAAPRTGTNRLIWAMRQYEAMAGYSELFDQNGVWGLLHDWKIKGCLESKLNIEINSETQPDLIQAFAQKPIECFTQLADCIEQAEKKIFLYKVFAQQVAREKLQMLLAFESTTCLIVERRWIDTIISYYKAIRTGDFVFTDHTSNQIELSFAEVKSFYKKYSIWYQQIFEELRQNHIPFEVIKYETHVDVTDGTLFTWIEGFLARHFDTHQHIDVIDEKHRLTKQDRTVESFDKLSNGDELRKTLEDEDMLDTILGWPSDEQTKEVMVEYA